MIDWTLADAENSDLEINATELRRLRLNVSGAVGGKVKYKVEVNTNSSNEINVEDAYLEWGPNGSKVKFKLGHFKTPNSLSEATSSRFTTGLERPAFTDAFELNRRVGVAVSTSGSNYTLSAGAFGDNLSENSRQEGSALAARGTFNPIKEDDVLVHLGASIRYRQIGDTQDDLRYRQRAFAHIPSRIISTGRIADSDMFYGVEAAGMMGSVWASAEYANTEASCDGCSSDPSFDGAYAEIGTFFGGKRTYKGGKFNRPVIDSPITDGGMGAVSVFARYDTLDLTDQAVDGGDMETIVLGADWWPTKYSRLSLNYFDVDANLGTSTSGLDPAIAALVSSGAEKEGVSGFTLRAHYDF